MRRFPELQGALNFRDMGGYPAADGKRTRWNVLYRSGTTHAMTKTDLLVIDRYGIRHAHDLRSNSERREYPSVLAAVPGLEYQCIDHDALPGDVKRLMASAESIPAHSRSMMLSAYRKIPTEFLQGFRKLFHHLTDAKVPLVFSCSAGKDRTGVAAALLLSALKVPRDAVLEDYLLSNESFERSCELLLQGNLASLFTTANRDMWEPLMRVDADYLLAAFDEIDKAFGSLGGYLSNGLNLSASGLNRLRGSPFRVMWGSTYS